MDARTYADVVVLTPAEQIDHTTAKAFEKALLPRVEGCVADGGTLVLDLSGVEYMSSAGLRVLMNASKQISRPDAILLAGMGPIMQEIFAISRFHQLFKAYPGIRDALAAASPRALAAFDGGRLQE